MLGALIRPGGTNWPRAWVSYQEWEGDNKMASLEKDFADLKAHGVGLVSMNATSVGDAKSVR